MGAMFSEPSVFGIGDPYYTEPDAKNVPLKAPVIPFVARTTNYTAPPQQAAIQNNFSSTNQSQIRFGNNPSHF